MSSMSEFYFLIYFMAAIGSVVTAIVTWWLCAIRKRGLDEHVGIMQLIYEEIRKSNRPDSQPVQSPPNAP